ncbi:MAG: hypothetical protein LBT20_05220 [Clostridiales bacterium]|jgi:hypothetical protein|nr:hypothetical protein [Clostridiales bacterium]
MKFLETAFEDYFREYLKAHGITTRAAIEQAYNDVLDEWKGLASEDFGGETPVGFLTLLREKGKLADYILGVYGHNLKIGDLTVEFVMGLDRTEKNALLFRLFSSDNQRCKLFAVDMLDSDQSEEVTELLLDALLAFRSLNEKTANAIFDVLKDGRTGLDSLILEKTAGLSLVDDDELKDMLSDILSGYGGELVRRIVTEGFLSGANPILYASLLGRCGDEESITVLKEYLKGKELPHTEYAEIRNAVERLGGYL